MTVTEDETQQRTALMAQTTSTYGIENFSEARDYGTTLPCDVLTVIKVTRLGRMSFSIGSSRSGTRRGSVTQYGSTSASRVHGSSP